MRVLLNMGNIINQINCRKEIDKVDKQNKKLFLKTNKKDLI